MDKDLACSCGELLVKSTSTGAKLRGKVLILEGTSLKSVCKSCGKEVALPFTVQENTTPKLVLSRKKVVEV